MRSPRSYVYLRSIMGKVVVFIVFCSFWSSLSARDSCVYLFSIPKKADFTTADHLGNIYLLRGFEVEKYDSTGHFVSRFSTNRLGAPTYVDVYNPLKIMVWYGEFQTAVFLDRNLTELGRVNLAQAGLPALRCLTVAADGNLWAYDDVSTQLLKLNPAGQKLLESQPLALEFGRQLAPTCIRDNSGQGPWMSDPELGVLVFDPYLRNSSAILVKNLQSFVIQEDMACFIEKGTIRMEPVQGLGGKTIAITGRLATGAQKIWLAAGALLALTDAGVEVYHWR
ncbi:MAG TPA: hypothetical protein VK168_19835 [Saprospiraceae bacterium]|nr:hypothetical protein [Saprospiraceae bacterium]